MASTMCLRDVSLTVAQKEKVVICGPSGSGKVDHDPLHQPAGCAPGRADHRRRHRADRRSARAGHHPARGRHGVPVLQPVPASDDPGELHAGADLGAQDAEGRGRGAGDGISAPGENSRSRRRNIPGSSPAASSSAWRSRGRCACSRRSCCSTSRPPRSIRR